eukprot:XP_001703036.1 predicted protein [Chlamydomonas reinhardtii]
MATRPALPLQCVAAPRAGLAGRSLALTVRAAKGFGKAKPQPVRRPGESDDDDDDGSSAQQQRRRKGKTVKLYPGAMGLIPGQAQQQRVAGPPQAEGAASMAPELLVPSAPTEEEDDFAARLAALKDQLGLAGGALVFIAVFLVVAAGDYAPASKRYAGVQVQVQPAANQEADPTNDAATEALATTYAQLLQYDKAAGLLEKLTKRNPADSEAWRLLGESSLLSQQSRKAVPAFERAVELRRAAVGPPVNTAGGVVMQPDLQLLTGLVDAYIANGEYGKDALATYEELIKAFPEDYRGYLAKGVFLKERGRKADAERMFLQARFYAPASKQQLVRAIADATPTAPQLPDNN